MSYSYTTAAYVKEELRASTNFSSSTTPTANTVTRWITEVSEIINREAGQVFGEQTVSETIDWDGEEWIVLANAPIISVTSLLYSTAILGSANYALTSTATEGTHYSAYTDSGEIYIIPQYSGVFKPGVKTMQINYTSGYSTTPLDVQMLATKMVALRVLDSLLNQNVNEGNTGGSVSVGSISIVEPDSISVGTYKQLKMDIEELRNKVSSGYKTLRYSNRLMP